MGSQIIWYMPIIPKLRNGMFARVMLLRSTNGMTVDWVKEIDYSYHSPKIISNGIVASKFDISVLKRLVYVRFVSRGSLKLSLTIIDSLICCLAIIYMCKRNRYRIKARKLLLELTNSAFKNIRYAQYITTQHTFILWVEKDQDHLKLDTSVDRDVESVVRTMAQRSR